MFHIREQVLPVGIGQLIAAMTRVAKYNIKNSIILFFTIILVTTKKLLDQTRQLTAEILGVMGSSGVNVLHKICDDIWHTGKLPCD